VFPYPWLTFFFFPLTVNSWSQRYAKSKWWNILVYC
jgi:hypothetical protein